VLEERKRILRMKPKPKESFVAVQPLNLASAIKARTLESRVIIGEAGVLEVLQKLVVLRAFQHRRQRQFLCCSPRVKVHGRKRWFR
jgi:hypothetical protein